LEKRSKVEAEDEAAAAAGAAGRGAHLPGIASQGGRAVVEKYGAEYMAQIGKRGAKSVAEKYGPGFYAEMGARNRGVKKRRRG